MDQQEILNNDNCEDDENDWESIPENEKTEETKDILYRLNIEKASKVKLDIHKLKKYHSIKVKKLDKKEIESFFELDKYIKEQYLPNIKITDNTSNPYVTILNNDYILKKHPEVGTYLIYEMDENKKEANLIGKSDTWLEATISKPKISIRRKIINNPKYIPKEKKILSKKNIKDKININEKKENKINLLNKKRKRKKKKRKYPKDSTVIEIKRILGNKDNEEGEEDKTNIKKDIKNINIKENSS